MSEGTSVEISGSSSHHHALLIQFPCIHLTSSTTTTIPVHPIRRAAPPETGHPSGYPAFRRALHASQAIERESESARARERA